MGQCEKHGRYDHYYCVTCAREQRRQPIPAEESSTDHETTALNHALKLALGYQAEINDLKSQLAKSKEAEFAIGSQVEELKAQLEKKDDYYANELERLGLGSKFDLTQKLAAVESERDQWKSNYYEAVSWRDKLQSENDKLIGALEKCCAPEPDGFGDFVADEFTEQCVLDGRKLLAEVRGKEESK